MKPFSEFGVMSLLGLCNLILGPIIISGGIVSDVANYKAQRNANNKSIELALEYVPLFCAYLCMIICSFCSGLCAIMASAVVDCKWVIRLAKVANFFSKLLYWQILLFVLYNWDPMEWRIWEGLPTTWGSINLPTPTCLYCVLGQLYFVNQSTKLISGVQNLLKWEQAGKKTGRKRRRE
ncbi:uncharacterized protein LOC110850034 [Folsomia candida]|nr:uncharacterized protein LOC110850034 [Folsomia candida]